jgi:uncharacterized coiled-coil DUF342 family protein
MKMIGFLCFMISAGYQLQAGVTPVQKVIQMMEEMKSKAIAEKEKEIKLFKEYMSWCKDTTTDKKHEIITATDEIERLEATISKNTVAATELADKVAAIDADIAQWSSDKDAATEVREKEKADYQETNTDYTESIDALGKAIVALSKSQGSVPQAMMLLQQIATEHRVPDSAQDLLQTLLADDAEQPTNPPVAGYESQSGGIVKIMEDLQAKFEEERAALQKEEMEGAHAFNMLELELEDQITYGTKERDTKAAKANEHKATVAEAKGELATQKTVLSEAETYLVELTTQCTLKSEAFEARQKTRAEELEAIEKAIEIISGEAVKGGAEKHLPSLVQKSFVHLRSSSRSSQQQRAAKLLKARALRIGSDRLSLLAVKVESDPFAKVINMIKGLITKLKEEAAAESAHKAWCDEELKNNKLTRDEKRQEVEMLNAKVDEINAAIDKLTADIQSNEEAMAELDKTMKEATEVRFKEKAKNEETIADAKAALEAVAMALKVLKEFYAKAAASLLQHRGPADDAPESFSNEAYTGQQGASKGVVGMLEVIQSDFARLESETSTDEALAAKEYETLMDESATDREAKRVENVKMGRQVTAKERALASTQKDLKSAQEELEAAQAYFDKLKPDCIEEGLSFEERAKMRQEEIDSLKEAYDILDGISDE